MAGNREKGEATVTINEIDYRLVMNMHAWSLAQDALTKGDRVPTIEQITKRFFSGHLLTTEAVFWGLLQKYHPEIATIAEASALIEAAPTEAASGIRRALQISEPDAADVAELREVTRENPRRAQTRTRPQADGDASTLAPAKSA